jgi:hypothetical protein
MDRRGVHSIGCPNRQRYSQTYSHHGIHLPNGIVVVGGDVEQQQTAPKEMPLITAASAESPFDPCSQDCPICMDGISGKCLMSQCKHALHKECMEKMFKRGINVCPFCRAQIKALVSETLAEDASADANPETPKDSEE